jgi:hypothetical protein
MAYADLYLAKFSHRQLPRTTPVEMLDFRTQVDSMPTRCRASRSENLRELFEVSGVPEMTFCDLQIGDIFRDVPSEFGEIYMKIEPGIESRTYDRRICTYKKNAVCLKSPNPDTIGRLVFINPGEEVEIVQ